MKAVWVTRSFLDYRIPVYRELNGLLDGGFALVYSADIVPARVRAKASAALGDNAIPLKGERRLGPREVTNYRANSTLRIPWQPGLVRTIREQSPDVLITDGFFQWTAAALWLRFRKRVPHVLCYERTRHTERNAQWFRKLYRKLALNFVDAMCCNGRLCGEYSTQIGMPVHKMTYGHMVADTEGLVSAASRVDGSVRETLRQRFKLRGMLFLYVGRLTVEKGLRQLLAAWEKVGQTGSASLILAGDGPDRQFLEGFCRARSLDNVHFLGAVDYDRLAPYYASADLFVIPTLEDNWSLVVPEAMACGLPILCSKYNGCWPELVQEERNGWVFDPLDLEDTCKHLRTCFHSVARFPEMGQESKRIVQSFTPRTAAESILRACEMAIAGASADRAHSSSRYAGQTQT